MTTNDRIKAVEALYAERIAEVGKRVAERRAARATSPASLLSLACNHNLRGGVVNVPVAQWNNGERSTPATGYRFWGVTPDGELKSPVERYDTTAVSGLDIVAGACRRGCSESPGVCGGCGITVLLKAEHLNMLRSMFDRHVRWSGRVVAARVGIVAPLHWTSSLIGRRAENTGDPRDAVSHIAIWAHPDVPEARAAAVHIEALQVGTQAAHLADKITARYGLPVAIDDDFAQLAPASTTPTRRTA